MLRLPLNLGVDMLEFAFKLTWISHSPELCDLVPSFNPWSMKVWICYVFLVAVLVTVRATVHILYKIQSLLRLTIWPRMRLAQLGFWRERTMMIMGLGPLFNVGNRAASLTIGKSLAQVRLVLFFHLLGKRTGPLPTLVLLTTPHLVCRVIGQQKVSVTYTPVFYVWWLYWSSAQDPNFLI